MSAPNTSGNCAGNSTNAGPSRGRGRGAWRPYNKYRNNFNRSNNVPREKPVALCIPTDAAAVNLSIASNNSQPPIALLLNKQPDEYPTWKLYHPQEAYMEGSKTANKVRALEKHFQRNLSLYNLTQTEKTFNYILNIQNLQNDANFISDWTNFKQDLQESPEHTLLSAGLAMHQFIINKSSNNRLNSNLKTIKPRVHGHGPVINIRSLKVNSYNKMISVRGTIIRVGGAYISCTWLAFKCSSCETQQAIRQPEGIMTLPTSCQNCRSRSNFIPVLSSPFTKTETFQELRLQESSLCDQYESGRVPRNIEVEISEDLVDSVCPGDDVILTGILKVKPQDEFVKKDQANTYKMYLQCVTILSNKNSLNSRRTEYTSRDMEAIRLIKSEPNPFRLLIHSLCPKIYGHEVVKAGLILGLFGGSTISPTNRRNETHVLVVGDPGVGKTQMLQACANISPRGIFVCGNSSTNAGLTVTVRHERGTGSALEAGALILADQGACCIDEFDKMASNQQSLLEVMEQQTVSIAKAGVLCTLPARTSILAAANPSGGHYDKSKTVSENLRIGPALLSRFDLVFIVLDRPNEYNDSLLTKHIQSLYAKYNLNNLKPSGSKVFNGNQSNSTQNDVEDIPLHESLKLKPNENLDLLPHQLMQKYIGYAKKNINPILSPQAESLIKQFYLELRQVQHGTDTIPVTIRQLEALIRVTQARARIDLAETATEDHAKDVLAIFRQSMVDVLTTDTGMFEMNRGMNGAGISQASQVKKFLNLLECKYKVMHKTIFSEDEMKTLAKQNGIQMNFFQLIDTLNIQGYLLKKGMHLYKLMVE